MRSAAHFHSPLLSIPGTASAEVVTVTGLASGTTYNVTRGVNGNR
jgi:hypothetical protein